MSEMVDQVARAIYGDDLFSADEGAARLAASPLTVDAVRKDARAAAKRAIEATLAWVPEPTWRAMMAAAKREKAPATPQRRRPGHEAAQP